jgi:hypothetical protein
LLDEQLVFDFLELRDRIDEMNRPALQDGAKLAKSEPDINSPAAMAAHKKWFKRWLKLEELRRRAKAFAIQTTGFPPRSTQEKP